MNYAIQQLQVWENNFKEISDFIKSYHNKENKEPKGVVLEFLTDEKEAIEDGLKLWGDSYGKEKKHQEKKLNDILIILSIKKPTQKSIG